MASIPKQSFQNKENVAPTSFSGKSAAFTGGPSSKYNFLKQSGQTLTSAQPRTGKPILGQLPTAQKSIRRDIRQPQDIGKVRHRDEEALPVWESTRGRMYGGLLYPMNDLEYNDLVRTADWEVKKDQVGPIEKSGFFVERVKAQAQKVANTFEKVGQKLLRKTEQSAPGLVEGARKGVAGAMRARSKVESRLYGPRFKQTWSTAGPLVVDYPHPYPQRLTGARLPTASFTQAQLAGSLPTKGTLKTEEGLKPREIGENRDVAFFTQGLVVSERQAAVPGGEYVGSSSSSILKERNVNLPAAGGKYDQGAGLGLGGTKPIVRPATSTIAEQRTTTTTTTGRSNADVNRRNF